MSNEQVTSDAKTTSITRLWLHEHSPVCYKSPSCDHLCRWTNKETESERGRVRKEKNNTSPSSTDSSKPSSLRDSQIPPCLNYSSSPLCIKACVLYCVVLACSQHHFTFTIQTHSLPDTTLPQQITAINTYSLSTFPPFHLTKQSLQ